MKDFIGQELNVGDTVVMIAPNYRILTKAVVESFTTQKVRVTYVNDWNFQKPGREEKMIQRPDQMVKVI